MEKIRCRLISHSPGTHIQQVYTGLSMLHRSGLIHLTQQLLGGDFMRAEAPQHLRDAAATHARVVLNDAVTVHYDMHDAQDIDLRDLDTCDYYFKRSFSPGYIGTLPHGAEKILPFGLNCHVLPNFIDPLSVGRAFGLRRGVKERIVALREALDAGNRLRFYSRVRELESLPDYALAPRVLFLVTAYDPHDRPDRSADKIQERIHNNETRAQCIRLLRKELGPRFLGGFNRNEYTLRQYQDCVVSDTGVTDKKNFVRTLKAHTICVATTGLHGSIGWKFAEYISCARAIVSERLAYQVPGGLAPDQNYLEFTSPAECVEQVLRLIADHDLRNQMMTGNSLYYRAHLRPDALLLNSLLTVLSKAEQRQTLPFSTIKRS
ncbi:MAG: hypothetical protein ABI702_12645 [Burkholderiales bacterium]